MSETQVIQLRPDNQQAIAPLSSDDVLRQVRLIQDIMHKTMREGEHWGKVPGCGDKPTLLKAGAEKLCLTFRMAPRFEIQEVNLTNNHKEYRVTCELYSIQSNNFLGAGVGTCTTMESKYRYRNAARKCPQCGKETIIKGKPEYGAGWLCWANKGGCGAKFEDSDKTIENQPLGKVENPDPADAYNTVLKMAKKRAQVDAILTATAASDIFTQDIEELDRELLQREAAKNVTPKAKTEEEQQRQAPARTPAPKPQQHTGDPETIDGIIAEVIVKSGTGKKGEWTRYGVTLQDDPEGRVFASFDKDVGAAAEHFYNESKPVTIRYKQEGKYLNIVSIDEVDNIPMGESEEQR